MNRTWVISKYFVKNALEEMLANKKMKAPIVAIIMLAIVMCISLPFCGLVGGLYSSFKTLGQEGMLISMLLLSGGIVIFFFGIFTVMNIFYFSNDIEYMLPLPFKSSQIILGKFLAVMINMCIYSGILILPLITYGVKSGSGITYYIYVIICLAILPIFPMVLASIICMTLMRFTSLSKHKDVFKMVTGCLALVLVVVMNLFFQSSNADSSPDAMVELISKGNNSGMKMLTGLFVTNKFSANALLNSSNMSGLTNILLAILFSVCIFVAYYIVGGKLYLKGVIGISESFSKRENILAGDTQKLIKESSPIRTLVIKDIKIILRTPQFFINCIAMLFYMPAILGVMILSRGGAENIRNFINQGDKWNAIFLVIVFVGSVLCISSGGAGFSALSREGKDFTIAKYIPVDYKEQLNAKIISSLCINGFSALIVIAIILILKLNPIITVLGGVVSIATVILITLFGMYTDFKSPKLDWEDERSMFKNNWMPLLIMFLMLIAGGLLALLAYFVKNYFIIFIVILILDIVISIAFYDRLVLLADKIYNEE